MSDRKKEAKPKYCAGCGKPLNGGGSLVGFNVYCSDCAKRGINALWRKIKGN